MKGTNARSFTMSLRDWLDADEQNFGRLAKFVFEKATSPHFGFFKLMVDLVDGPVDPESAPGRIFPDDHTLVIVDELQSYETANAA
jgi:hypothetical protein